MLNCAETVKYHVLVHPRTVDALKAYRAAVETGSTEPGTFLSELRDVCPARTVDWRDFLHQLISTKRPLIFAESAVGKHCILLTYDRLSPVFLRQLSTVVNAQLVFN